MPSWISDGFSEYAQRLRAGVQLELIEVETPRRGSNVDLSRVVREEGARLLRAAPSGTYRIALDQDEILRYTAGVDLDWKQILSAGQAAYRIAGYR